MIASGPNPDMLRALGAWCPDQASDLAPQIAALLESLQAAGLLRASPCAVLLGEQYHLGGEEDTRRMAHALDLTAADRVLDLACYVGGPARQLARDYGCQVVGVDISEDCIAIAEKLTELCGQNDCSAGSQTCGRTKKVRFICASAVAVPEPDESFTVAWSQCSFPSDLSWLPEIHRLLVPGGRVGFTGLIRPEGAHEMACSVGRACRTPQAGACPPQGDSIGGHTAEQHGGYARPTGPASLGEIAARTEEMGFRVLSAEDISDWELEHGWLPTRRKLEENEAHYRNLLGDEWVKKAYQSIDEDIAAWREGRLGSGRVVAVKE